MGDILAHRVRQRHGPSSGLEGDYLKANGGGGSNTYMDVINTTGTYVTYTPEDIGTGGVRLRTHNGRYLRTLYSNI